MSLSRAFILFEVDEAPGITAQELTPLLRLDKGSLSRLLHDLEEQELLVFKSDPHDQRKKRLEITRAGKKMLTRLIPFFEITTDETVVLLTHAEKKKMEEIYRSLSDGFKAADIARKDGESPLRHQLRRFSYCSGVLTRSYMDTGHGISECEILYLLYAHAGLRTVSDLAEVLPLDLSTISRSISQFAKQGYVRKQVSEADRRQHTLALTTKGRNLINRILDEIGTKLNQALGRNAAAKQDYIHLLFKSTSELRLPDKEGLKHYRVGPLNSTRQKSDARTFYITQLYRRRLLDHIPQHLFTDKSLSFGLFQKGKLRGALSFHNDTEEWVLENLITVPELESDSHLIANFILTSALKARRSDEIKKIRVPKNLLHAESVRTLPGVSSDRRNFFLKTRQTVDL
jgi:DNA-binding MarR family transcriptional regulator